MHGLKVPLKDAQKVKELLVGKGLLSAEWKVKKSGSFIYFPLKKAVKLPYPVVDIALEPREVPRDIRTRLKDALSSAEMQQLKTSADTIGSIAIIELDAGLEKKKKIIGKEFLRQNKSIKTVLMKSGGHEGELRLQKFEFLAGVRTTEAVHKENGAIIRLDVEKVYYSPRTANERLRIARQVLPGERVLVMFSGCAPFPCVIAKNAQPKEIAGIELNQDGHKYGLENVKVNKLKNVHLICGDVKTIVPKLMTKNDKRQTTFDRIIMPLPKSAGDFLDTALLVAKKGTIIHFYNFQKEGEFDIAADMVKSACKKAGMKCKILRIVKAGQNAPRTFRICVDAVIL
ncbi:MAG: class I SAM-dependent methyltransferase family protein [Nanoarchaeota archaeon]